MHSRALLPCVPLLLVVPLALAGCGRERAASCAATSAHSPGGLVGFSRVELAAPILATIHEGPAFDVRVEAPPEIAENILTYVEGDTLVVTTRPDADWSDHDSDSAKVAIELPALAGVRLRGSGDAKILAADSSRPVELDIAGSGDLEWNGGAGSVSASVEGSGDLHLRGRASRLAVAIVGSGDVDASGLSARGGDFSIAGSGDIHANLVGGPASFVINGSGDIVWSGNAQVTRMNVNGSGTVRSL